jgi:hypothetical protein
MFASIYRNKVSQISKNFNFRNFSNSSGSGDIRGAGGSFGRKEKAQEDQFFRQKEKEELAEFKKKLEQKDKDKVKDKIKPALKPSPKK